MRALTSRNDHAHGASVVSTDAPAIHDPPNHGGSWIQTPSKIATVMVRGKPGGHKSSSGASLESEGPGGCGRSGALGGRRIEGGATTQEILPRCAHSINGYVFGSLPMPKMKVDERMRWYG